MRRPHSSRSCWPTTRRAWCSRWPGSPTRSASSAGAARVFTDAVQASSFLNLAETTSGADLVAVSAHKVGGPVGAGALAVRSPTDIVAHQYGGGQERERRSGTQDVVGAVGLAVALRLATAERSQAARRVAALRDRLASGLAEAVPGLSPHRAPGGGGPARAPPPVPARHRTRGAAAGAERAGRLRLRRVLLRQRRPRAELCAGGHGRARGVGTRGHPLHPGPRHHRGRHRTGPGHRAGGGGRRCVTILEIGMAQRGGTLDGCVCWWRCRVGWTPPWLPRSWSKQGHDVVGATLKLWGGPSDSGCCSVADVDDARRVAQQLGIEHHVFNLTEEFDRHVVAPYVEAHVQGRTPNPCIECNRSIKFDRLLARSDRLGFDRLATGHHARVDRDARSRLRRGADVDKDQSYVLSMLGQAELGRVLFPVGEMTKADVRAHAAGWGCARRASPTARTSASSAASEGRQGFLGRQAASSTPPRSPTGAARRWGRSSAVELVTVGQRRGMGHGTDGARRYVIAVDVPGAPGHGRERRRGGHVGRRAPATPPSPGWTSPCCTVTAPWPRSAPTAVRPRAPWTAAGTGWSSGSTCPSDRWRPGRRSPSTTSPIRTRSSAPASRPDRGSSAAAGGTLATRRPGRPSCAS